MSRTRIFTAVSLRVGLGPLVLAGFLATSASASVLYTDGPNDNVDFTANTPGAPLINGGHATSDSFIISQTATVTSVNFALATYASEQNIPSLEWSITSAPDSSGTMFGTGTSNL